MTSFSEPLPFRQLKHGAIYRLNTDWGSGHLEARCNISPDGDEIWFTDKTGKEQGGEPVEWLRDSDTTFRHRDNENPSSLLAAISNAC